MQLARRGFGVTLIEQKPKKRTPAQIGDGLAELVCSNSMRGAALSNAVGLLKEELRQAGSLVMEIADRTRVPAGGALAVDRERFSAEMTAAIRAEGRIEVVCDEVRQIPEQRPVILATGPLTGDDLAADLAARVGSQHLAYYDAIAPILSAESLDWDKVFKQSRYGKGSEDGDDEAYVNCPLDEAQYKAFVAALVGAEKVKPREFEKIRYFEGCLPVEVMAERGEQTLSFGPMKPVGLVDPRTGRRPHAVIQLRPEDANGTSYNMVGFQTRMTYGEQQRVFRTVPGLESVEFMRFGSVHRNTFVNAPVALDETMQLKAAPGVFLAGQVTGVEGYVESAAGGFLCALFLARRLAGAAPLFPPDSTALGGLRAHLLRPNPNFQPSNVTWAHFPPLDNLRLKKRERYDAMAERALRDLGPWVEQIKA